MDFDLKSLKPGEAYKLLSSVVVPRPIALVTSLNEDGRVNAAPFSFFNMMGSQPPIIALNIADRQPGVAKDSRANIQRVGEFAVSLVDEALAHAMNITGIEFPTGISELDAAGLSAAPGTLIGVPHVAESPVSMECRLHSLVEIGQNRVVLAEVVFLHIRDEFVDAEHLHVRTEELHLIGRMHGGGWYARTTDLFDMPRIPYARWLEEHETES